MQGRFTSSLWYLACCGCTVQEAAMADEVRPNRNENEEMGHSDEDIRDRLEGEDDEEFEEIEDDDSDDEEDLDAEES
jgi:hypothetical protein